MTYATLNFYPNKDPRMRFFALWYFTILLIIWTITGDTVPHQANERGAISHDILYGRCSRALP